MTESLPHPSPMPEDYEMLRDAALDLSDAGFTTLPPETDPEKYIFWLERYRGLDNVTIHEYTDVALILAREI